MADDLVAQLPSMSLTSFPSITFAASLEGAETEQ